jgi:2,4-dienoyl-CoA reductase (NADPH2)
MLKAGGFDEVIVATGIEPRRPELPGIDHPKVVGYIDAILGRKPIGRRVAIMGAGGIGFDVAELISHEGTSGATRHRHLRARVGHRFQEPSARWRDRRRAAGGRRPTARLS